MIDRREILESASALGLLPSVIEKDYILGWILGGINAHPELSESWVFKGGTCLKKCYFETYRFSEDLDFTLRDESHLDEALLNDTLSEVVAWVTEESGLTMPADQLSFDIYRNPRGRLSCQGRIGYRGPVSPTTGGWPKIKLDLTADETLVLPSVRREVFHPYSDRPEVGLWDGPHRPPHRGPRGFAGGSGFAAACRGQRGGRPSGRGSTCPAGGSLCGAACRAAHPNQCRGGRGAARRGCDARGGRPHPVDPGGRKAAPLGARLPPGSARCPDISRPRRYIHGRAPSRGRGAELPTSNGPAGKCTLSLTKRAGYAAFTSSFRSCGLCMPPLRR